MALNTVIGTNLLALNTNRNLSGTSRKKQRHSNRLSSGKKLNSASEDAAGVTINQKMKAQIRGLDMAEKNSEDTISMLQIMEGAMTEISNIFQSARELSVQAANDTNSVEDKRKLAKEMSETLKQIDFILEETKYSEQKLFAQGINKNFQIGANVNQNLNMTVDYMTFEELMDGENMEFYNQVSKLFNDTIKKAIDGLLEQEPQKVGNTCVMNGTDTTLVDYAPFLEPIKKAIADMGTFGNKEIEKLKNEMQADLARIIQDARDTAEREFNNRCGANLDTQQFWLGNGNGKYAIINKDLANAPAGNNRPTDGHVRVTNGDMKAAIKDPNKVVVIDTDLNPNDPNGFIGKIETLQKTYKEKFLDKKLYSFNLLEDLEGFVEGNIDIPSSRFSETYIHHFDKTIGYISDKRAELGSTINRLEYTIGGLQTSSENLTLANSQIEDADMAGEMMGLAKTNVLINASMTLLSQANSSKENVLQLLN